MSVSTLITDAKGYAKTATGDAKSALDDAKKLLNNIGFTIVAPPSKYAEHEPPEFDDGPEAPELDPINLDLPHDVSPPPELTPISPLEPGDAPTFDAEAPTLELPTAPSALEAFTEVSPAINTNIVFPEPPSQLSAVINEPTFTTRTEPTRPQTSIPLFTGVAPTDAPTAPTDLQGTFRNAYAEAAPSTMTMVKGYVDNMLVQYNPRYFDQMAAIEAQLSKYLAGGTGLNSAAENAIYERSRSKQDAESRRVRDAAYAESAARGFTLPTGALTSAIQQARQGAADNNAAAAREIVVMQAEMEQKNLQFAVTTSTALRTTMLNAALSYMQNLVTINGQALDYAKSVLNAVVETYNTAVKAFGLKLDAYRAEAAVYETRIKGALAVIQLYEAEVRALEALTNVDQARVAVYRSRIDALNAYANVYKAKIDAVISKASLEKVKLDLFQSKVQAFTARVQAKNAEWQGYTAAIGGEEAKARMYGSQVNAYQAELQGYSATVSAKAEVVRAQATTSKAVADQYTSKVQAYSAVVSAKGTKAQAELENQRQRIQAFSAETQAATAKFQVRSEYYRAVALIGIERAKLDVTTFIQNAELKKSYGATLAQLSTSAADVYSRLAGSAMSGMNTLAGEIKYE